VYRDVIIKPCLYTTYVYLDWRDTLSICFSHEAYKCAHNRKVIFFCPYTGLLSETAKVFLPNEVHLDYSVLKCLSVSHTYLRLKLSLSERQLHTTEERLLPSLLLKHKRNIRIMF